MEKEKPRLARLTAILTHLLSRRIVTASELAKKHDVSIRTVYRDIRTLEKSGVPIVTEEGKGYSLMEGYKMPPVMFTEEEANALITAEQIISKNKDASLAEHYKNAITKVKSVLQYRQKEKADLLEDRLQIRNNPGNEKTSDYLMRLQSAITNYQTVHIHYLSLENKLTKRNFEPFALFSTHENWVLIARCQTRNDFRYFRLDQVREMHLTGESFPPHKITLQQYFDECRQKWQSTPDTPMSLSADNFAVNQNISKHDNSKN